MEHADGRAKARFYVLKKRIQKKPSQEEKQAGARLVVEETDEAGRGAVGNLAAHSPAEGKRKASQLHVWENTQPLRRGAEEPYIDSRHCYSCVQGGRRKERKPRY